MFNLNKYIDGGHLAAVRVTLDNASLDESKNEARAYTEDKMRTQLAEFLRREKIEVNRKKYSTDFELRVLVFTPDEFAQVVMEAATEYYTRGPRQPFSASAS